METEVRLRKFKVSPGGTIAAGTIAGEFMCTRANSPEFGLRVRSILKLIPSPNVHLILNVRLVTV